MAARKKFLKNPSIGPRITLTPEPKRLTEKQEREIRSLLSRVASVWAVAESGYPTEYTAGHVGLEKRKLDSGQIRWHVSLCLIAKGRAAIPILDAPTPSGKFLGTFHSSLHLAMVDLDRFLEAQAPILKPFDAPKFEAWRSLSLTSTDAVQKVAMLLNRTDPTLRSTPDEPTKKTTGPRNQGRRRRKRVAEFLRGLRARQLGHAT